MGLPLFVAPVKSDVARKPSQKNAATSPLRSAINRYDRTVVRDRRNVAARRAAAITNRPRTSVTTSYQRPLSLLDTASTDQRLAPAATANRISSVEPSNETERRDPQSRRTLGDRRGTWRRRREGRLPTSINWHYFPPPQAGEDNFDTVTFDEQGRPTFSRSLTPISSRFTRSPDILGSEPAQTSSSLLPPQHDASTRQRHSRLAQLARHAYVRRPNQNGRSSTDANGLGDRQRSLSPEEWDAFLSTLSPDHESPSASTSLVSNTGSQDAGRPVALPSTGNSILPDGFDDAPIDAGCDSGCEQSDQEDADSRAPRRYLDQVAYLQLTQLAQSRRIRDNEGDIQLPRTRHSSGENGQTTAEMTYRDMARYTIPVVQSDTHGQPDAHSQPDANAEDSWLGRALIDANEAESTDDGTGNMTVTPLSALVGAPGEEDLAGMQRIFRNLARRRDIPEEWWAEAGLSRSLSRQGAN